MHNAVDSCQGIVFLLLLNRLLDALRNNSGTESGKMSLDTLIFADFGLSTKVL